MKDHAKINNYSHFKHFFYQKVLFLQKNLCFVLTYS